VVAVNALAGASSGVRCARELYRLRYWILLVCVLVTALAAAGVLRLQLSSNYEIYFDNADPRLQALNDLHQIFSRNDNILFVLAPSDHQVFTPESLSAISALTQAAWQLPFATRVDSVTNFQYISSTQEGVSIAPLVGNSLVDSEAQAQKIKTLALRETALVGRLLSPQADVTGVNVRLQINGESRLAVSKAASAARLLAQSIQRQYPDITVRLTGNAILNAAFPEAGLYDMTHLTPFMYLVIFLCYAGAA